MKPSAKSVEFTLDFIASAVSLAGCIGRNVNAEGTASVRRAALKLQSAGIILLEQLEHEYISLVEP